MDLRDFLKASDIHFDVRVSSKKNCLQILSGKQAKSVGLDEAQVFTAVMDRERLGSTGVSHGVAVPHAHLNGLERVSGLFARLHAPVAYDAIDDQPVDLVFMLLAPEDAGVEHLKALSRVSRFLRDQEICAKIREADNADAIRALLIGPEAMAA